MFCGSLTCGIWAPRVECRPFRKTHPGWRATINLISADMDEAHVLETPRQLEETMGAENVGFQKWRSILNTAIHMRFRSKMNDRVEPVLKDFIDRSLVGNVATHEVISGILCDLHEVFDVSCVGKLVEVKDFDIAP